MMDKRTLLLAGLVPAVCIAAVQAGTFSFSPWTSDADSGISAGKIYTHTAKFQGPEGQPFYAGNGVWFEGDDDEQGEGWRFFNVPHVFTGSHGTNVTGAGANLLTYFIYGDDPAGIIHPQLQLTGLEPGRKYVTTFYAKGWENSGRVIDVSASDDPNSVIRIDQDLYGGGNGLLLKYTYTAPGNGQIVYTFDELNTNMSWHHYAFSNEIWMPVYVNPDPVPGTLADLTVTLGFEAVASEGVELVSPTYNVYWGSDPNALNAVTGLTEGSYMLEGLAEATTYYWQVEVVDEGQVVYSTDPNGVGRMWSFITKTLAPAEEALHWPMDETSGTVVSEAVGAYDGTAIRFDDPNEGGSAWVEGIVGNSLNFDGVDSYVDLGDAAPLPFGTGQAFSISGYVKTTDPAGPVVTFRNSTNGNPIVSLCVGFDGADAKPGLLRFISRGPEGGTLFRLDGPVVTDGGWNHFALTREVDGEITLYVNGQSYGSVNDMAIGYDVDWRAIGAELAWIANEGPGTPDSWFLEGQIDEVTVWDGVLKASQIQAMVDVIPYRLNPHPVSGAEVDIDTVLSWDVPFDRFADPTYNVYVGTDPDLATTIDGATGLTETQFTPTEPLEYETPYYWQVEVVSGGQVVYTSPIWMFTTVASTVGVWSVQPWTGDADSGLAGFKTYTHTGKFIGSGTDGEPFYAGNGVYFERDTNHAGTGWTLTGAPGVFGTNNPVNVGGDSGNLARGFFYGDTDLDHPVLTLTGLTPGTKYVTTFYTVGFGGAGGRWVDITASDNPTSPFHVDQNGADSGNGQLIKYTFTATTSEMSFTFDAISTGDSWHHYAFSNEVALPFELSVVAPSARAHVDAASVRLQWQDVPAGGAEGATFNLVVATDADLLNRVVDVTGLTEMTYTVEGLDPDTAYYWQVEGVVDDQVVFVTPVVSFFTRSTEPAAILVEWTMDDGVGTTVTETYAGLDGTLTEFDDPNAAWVPGLSGTALTFNGVDEYVDLGDISALSAPEGYAFSLSGYIKTSDPEGPIFSMRPPGILSVYVGFDGADSVPGHFRFISAAGGLRRITGPRVDDGRWHHFAVTRSRFGRVELYVDGVFAGATDDFGSAYTLGQGAFGTDLVWLADWSATHPAEQLHLDGLIDQVTIWSGVLLPSQIEALSAIVPARGDLNEDGSVDLTDLRLLAEGWLTSAVPADVDRSGRADMEDFGVLSQDWEP